MLMSDEVDSTTDEHGTDSFYVHPDTGQHHHSTQQQQQQHNHFETQQHHGNPYPSHHNQLHSARTLHQDIVSQYLEEPPQHRDEESEDGIGSASSNQVSSDQIDFIEPAHYEADSFIQADHQLPETSSHQDPSREHPHSSSSLCGAEVPIQDLHVEASSSSSNSGNFHHQHLVQIDSHLHEQDLSTHHQHHHQHQSPAQSYSIGQSIEPNQHQVLPGHHHHHPQQQQQLREDQLIEEHVISDLPVLSRARASLPSAYLYIQEIQLSSNGADHIYGVFARKNIPQRTQFGPVEGILCEYNQALSRSRVQPNLIVYINEAMILDQNDENTSNWMRFVRTARSVEEQNLVLVAKDQTQSNPDNINELITTTKFFFISTRMISPVEELKVWYSQDYLDRFGVNVGIEQCLLSNDSNHDQSGTNQEENQVQADELNSYADGTLVQTTGGHKLRNKMAKMNERRDSIDGEMGELSQEIIDGEEVEQEETQESTSTTTTTTTPGTGKKISEHKCDICGKVFPRFYSLRRHQIMHSGEKKYKCSVCGMSFSHVYNRNRHAKRHSKNALRRPFNLFRMNREDGEDDNGKGSMRTRRGRYKCVHCKKQFRSEEKLNAHCIASHQQVQELQKNFSCNLCHKRFTSNTTLTSHMKFHGGNEQPRIDCVICKQVFDTVQARREHVSIHADSKTGHFTCPTCFKRFEEFSAIRKHIRAFHSDKQYPCTECDKIFPRPDKLKLHMLRHSDHREFLCQNCGKQFKRKDKLKEHMHRMHAPDREAKLAAKAAAKQAQAQEQAANNANNQKRFIPKVSPTDYHRFIYKCHTCLLGFKRRGMLVNHLAKRHPDIPPDTVPELNLPILKTTRDYYCQYCEKVYKSSSKRKAHILKNHPGKALPECNRRKNGNNGLINNASYSATVGSITTHPHYCNWCHKQYASKAKLLQHQRKKHPDMLPPSSASSSTSSPISHKPSRRKEGYNGTKLKTNAAKMDKTNQVNNNNASLITILGSMNGLNIISSSDSDLSDLLQNNPSAANDLLTQAMSELTQQQQIQQQQQREQNKLIESSSNATSTATLIAVPLNSSAIEKGD